MACRVLILRPQPDAEATAQRARQLGLEPVVAPLFTTAAVPWHAPDPTAFDAVMLTSAKAAETAGSQLDRFTHLPCYAVGEATEASARAAGFGQITTGDSDGQALIDLIAKDGNQRILHLCGAARTELNMRSVAVKHRIVYETTPVPALPAAAHDAIEAGALVLLHSTRAAALFGSLCEQRAKVSIIAISETVAKAAGGGWASVDSPDRPRDQALLELAAKLCNSDDPELMGGQ